MRHRAMLGIAAVVLVAVVSSCTGPSEGATAADASAVAGSENEFDFSNPIPDGQTVSATDLQDAKTLSVPFTPLLLDGYTPTLVEETPPEQAPAIHRQIAFAYETPDTGQFVIFQYVLDAGAAMAEWEGNVAQPTGCQTVSPDPSIGDEPALSCHFGEREFVSLEDGTKAYLYTGENGVSLAWAVPIPASESSGLVSDRMDEPAIIVEIQALRVSMSRDQITQVANSVQAK